MVYSETNVETNKKVWNAYAESWDAKDDWLVRMAGDVGQDAADLAHLGDEWSDAASFTQVVEEYVLPYLAPHFAVAEIGVGGGRVAACVAGRVRRFVGLDVSRNMLDKAAMVLEGAKSAGTDVSLVLVEEPRFPDDAAAAGSLDFVCVSLCFSVCVCVCVYVCVCVCNARVVRVCLLEL